MALASSALLATAAVAREGRIDIVVGHPAGATSEALTRVVAEAMGRILKQTPIVENPVGAGGRLANERVKAAPADGTALPMAPAATMSTSRPRSMAGCTTTRSRTSRRWRG